MNRHHVICALGILVMLMTAGASWAQVELRFAPADTTIAPEGELGLSIVLDEAQDVRSFEVRLQYDPEVLTFNGGGPGLVFTESGCQLFTGTSEDTLGTLHGYVVILGANCWGTGPGELFRWDFTTSGLGTSPVTVESVALFAPQSGEIADVTLPGTTIRVADAQSDVPGLLHQAHSLGSCRPNPFNPSTTIDFEIMESCRVNVGVYSLDGRRVALLVDEFLNPGNFTTTWDGRDQGGHLAASGTYLYRLEAGEYAATKRMTMLK